MTTCPSCASQISEVSRFCATCGESLTPDLRDAPTRVIGRAGTSTAHSPSHSSTRMSRDTSSGAAWLSSSSSTLGRFAPGTMLFERYRIVGLLGKGGMGEVYRADDLKLGQPVALKFLPPLLATDPSRLDRFYNEVRLARQVSHPNVCRVYDISEIDELHVLSMEYVDGEDLGSLLRRIGRLPRDKAVEISRQICAGLAAAHDRGILHRDLKPANIMLDSKGQVRITDFGLAAVAQEITTDEIRVGTPAYMAPEQLAGKEVSVRSDIYSLGLVLYEIFSGKPAFAAGNIDELMRLQRETRPMSLSSIVHELDSTVERIVLRCLEPEPSDRPATALSVAAALPGGDPLAAALAAGETPSPEMVAAAGTAGAVSLPRASAALAAIFIGMIGVAMLARQATLIAAAPIEKPPGVLADRARDILHTLGYTEPPGDTDWSYSTDNDYLTHLEERDKSADRWRALGLSQPSVYGFWYRQSPGLLVPVNRTGGITRTDPPEIIPGMASVVLDTHGRLTQFNAVPPEHHQTQAASAAPPAADWTGLLTEAGFDIAKLTPVAPEWNPPVASDVRAAWTGTFAGHDEIPIRLEAAAFQGHPVSFRIIGDWTKPRQAASTLLKPGVRAAQFIGVGLTVLLLCGAALLARHNLRLGRGDPRGAKRLALAGFTVTLSTWILTASHVPDAGAEWSMMSPAIAISLFLGGFAWVIYVALEPYVRRRWPQSIVTWTRLLSGRITDPQIGRDILIGAFCGTVLAGFDHISRLAPGWLGSAPPAPQGVDTVSLLGLRYMMGGLLNSTLGSLLNPMFILFLLLTLRVLLKRQWLAVGSVLLLVSVLSALRGDNVLIAVIGALVVAGTWLFVLMRYGLFAMVVAYFFMTSLLNAPLTLDPSIWYAWVSFTLLAVLAAIALYGFFIAKSGRRMFTGQLFDN